MIRSPLTPIAIALSLLPAIAVAEARAPLAGVNQSGCEFKGAADGALCPKPDDIRYSIRQGFRLIRLPFRSSQLDQPAAWARIKAAVATANAAGVPVILDRHEFRWPPVNEQIGFWKRVVAALPADADIKLELMNEPKGFANPRAPHEQWARDTKAIVAGIRAFAPRTEILVEWPFYSATFRFSSARVAAVEARPGHACLTPACAIRRIGGLGRNVALSGHRYFDRGSAGINPDCERRNGTAIGGLVNGARSLGMKAYVTEIGWGSYRGTKPSCVPWGTRFLAEVRAGADVIEGYTIWGGGPAWSHRYPFRVEPPKPERDSPPSPYLKQITGR